MLPTLYHGDASSFCSGGSQPAPPIPQWELGPPCPRDTGDTSQIHGHDLWETQEHWTRSLDITVSVLAPSQLAVYPRPSHTPSLVPGKLWCLDRNVPILLASGSVHSTPQPASNGPAQTASCPWKNRNVLGLPRSFWLEVSTPVY